MSTTKNARRRQRRTGALAMLVAGVTLAAACGGGSSGSSTATTATGGASPSASAAATTAAPKSGGTLTFLYTFSPLQLDPLVAGAPGSAGDAPYEFAVFDALVYIDSSTGKLVYQTAESLIPSQGNLVWTLKLRPNIQFSDGTPYDASAVQFNWQRIADPANNSPNASTASQIASMTVVDPVTLQITLKAPNSFFANSVAIALPFIGSPTAIKAEGSQFGAQPVGAGPFVIKDWVRGSQVTYARNPKYWQPGRPYLDQLIINYVADDQQRLNTFNANGAQVAFMNLRSDLAQGAIKAGAQSSLAVPSGGVIYMLNEKKAPFSSLAARQAFAYAINYDLLNQTVFGGANAVPNSYFAPESPYYNSSILLPGYNQAKAQQLFDQAAKELGGPVEFTLYATPANSSNAEFVQAEVNQYKNVNMSLKTLTGAQVVPLVSTGDYQASTNQIVMYQPDPALYNNVQSMSSSNFVHFSNPDVDTALMQARTATDPAAAKTAYDTVQKILYDQVPFIMFTRPKLYFLLKNNVQGFVNTNNMVLSDRIWLNG